MRGIDDYNLQFMRPLIRPIARIMRVAVVTLPCLPFRFFAFFAIGALSTLFLRMLAGDHPVQLIEVHVIALLLSAIAATVTAWALSKNGDEFGKRFLSRFFAMVTFVLFVTCMISKMTYAVPNEIAQQLATYIGGILSLVIVLSSIIFVFGYFSVIPTVGIFILLQRFGGFPLDEVIIADSRILSKAQLRMPQDMRRVLSSAGGFIFGVALFFGLDGPNCWKIAHAPMSITAYVDGVHSGRRSQYVNYHYLIHNQRYNGTSGPLNTDMSLSSEIGAPITVNIDRDDPQLSYYGNAFFGFMNAALIGGLFMLGSVASLLLMIRARRRISNRSMTNLR